MTDRREAILDAALAVFARYGFRKTSMDEVARAAELSRPGLYLHFESKDALFVATVQHLLARTLDAVRSALASAEPLPERLADAFAAAHLHFVGDVDPSQLDELAATARALAPTVLASHDAAVRDAIVDALRDVPDSAAVADVLVAVSLGLKHQRLDAASWRARFTRLAGTVLRR